MPPCLHLHLSKMDDKGFELFESFKQGYRFYKCDSCDQIFKVKTAVITFSFTGEKANPNKGG